MASAAHRSRITGLVRGGRNCLRPISFEETELQTVMFITLQLHARYYLELVHMVTNHFMASVF
jgi:hypothetical protein